MTEEVILKVGLTPRHPCSYLGHEQEQLLVLMDHELLNAAGYERLLTAGFRRSGNDIYRPHCPACSACQSLRIHSERFVPNRGQKRVRQLNRDLELVLSYDDKPEYYQLYERYIRERHHDGSMYPPSRTQYKGFLHCDWMPPLYMEIRKEGRLIGVATTDLLTVLPRHFVGVASVRDELVWRPLPMTLPPVHVDALWHGRRNHDPAHRWLREAIARAARNTPAPIHRQD